MFKTFIFFSFFESNESNVMKNTTHSTHFRLVSHKFESIELKVICANAFSPNDVIWASSPSAKKSPLYRPLNYFKPRINVFRSLKLRVSAT
jgi:hypothetical protein